jgi:hypothetical protein
MYNLMDKAGREGQTKLTMDPKDEHSEDRRYNAGGSKR